MTDKKVRDLTSKRSKRSKKRKGGKSSSQQTSSTTNSSQTFSPPFSSQTSSTTNSSQTSSTTKVCEKNGDKENVWCKDDDDLLLGDTGNDISQAVKDLEVNYVFRSNSVYISLL